LYRRHRYLCSFPTRRSSDLSHVARSFRLDTGSSPRIDCLHWRKEFSISTIKKEVVMKRKVLGVWGCGVLFASMALAQGHQDYLEDRKSTRLNSSHVAISYAV